MPAGMVSEKQRTRSGGSFPDLLLNYIGHNMEVTYAAHFPSNSRRAYPYTYSEQ